MPSALTEFPHTDIRDEGPRVVAALCTSSRDEPEYRGWPDHNAQGLFIGGPKGEHNPLTRVQGFTYCAVEAPSPDAERKQLVTYRGREAARRRIDDPEWEPTQRFAYVGRFIGPRKPATSGRRRKAA